MREVSVDEPVVLAAMRAVLAELARGCAVQPVQVTSDLPDGGDVIPYHVVLPDADAYAIKVSSVFYRSVGLGIEDAAVALNARSTQEVSK